jgi:hypothetical protein
MKPLANPVPTKTSACPPHARDGKRNVPRKLLIHRIPIPPHIRLDSISDVPKFPPGAALADPDVQGFLRDFEEFPSLCIDIGKRKRDG